MTDKNDKTGQGNMEVDAEKILNHINYTRHWLDKADEDYQQNRYGNGGMILGLARAELTAAWEEALQLKTQVFRKMPRKARGMVTWKNSSAAGLVAAGFIMAFMVIQYGNREVGRNSGIDTRTVVLTEQSAAPAAAEAPAITRAELSAPKRAAAPSTAAAEAGRQAAVSAPAAVNSRKTTLSSARRTGRKSFAVVPALKPAKTPVAVVAPAVVDAQPPVRIVEVVKVVEPQQPVVVKKKHNLDGIDLYKTADDALRR